ncbi:MAG: cystathionine gamma-lyase [Elusimicrobia bacterium]|nr:MAG: cystathionine gamma-lyase [Elusimicrobiota bacterium]KAF0156869.1 MAG: cystathionine gamma-lyase [Elusimicrobiota bacterium]
MNFETALIHAGQAADRQTGSVSVPVYQTSTYKQDGIGRDRGWEYSRTGNPTRKALEDCIAALEGVKYGLAFASGLAAETAVLGGLLKKGDHVVAGDDLYGGTYRLFEKVFRHWGLEISYADSKDPASFKRAMRRSTRLVWVETPTNPLLNITDIAAVAETARKGKALLAVDNTFATPYFQRPAELGADIVVHSSTKYLGGHSDVIGGLLAIKDKCVFEAVKFYQNAAGAVPGPWDAWLTLRGIKTLSVRMKAHEANAFAIAAALSRHPAVSKVYYPGLESHPGHELAGRQMDGCGGMVGFELKGGRPAAESFFRRLKIFSLAESLGGVESLACYPAAMTHAAIPERDRLKRGITAGLVRLSAGIENSDDLLEDLARALK